MKKTMVVVFLCLSLGGCTTNVYHVYATTAPDAAKGKVTLR